jgi:hypothetical protein
MANRSASREVVVVEVVLTHQDVEGGEAEPAAPAIVQALDAAAVDFAVEDGHRMLLLRLRQPLK